LQQALESVLAAQREYSWVANGRFKGGYITRHFGRPQEGIDAVQLELAQCNYMDEDSFAYDGALAAPTQGLIRRLLEACLAAPDSR
jgi:N-formylglutamate deformylase